MGSRKIAWLGALVFCAGMLHAGEASAAGKILAWQQPLRDLADSYTHSVAPSICAVMIAVCGMSVLFGEGGRFKPFFNIALGTALAVNVAGGLLAFGFGSGDANILNPHLSSGIPPSEFHIKITNDVATFNILEGFMNHFIAVCQYGGLTLGGYALQLMGLLVTIEMAVALSLGLVNEDKIRYIFVQILKIGFFVWLINNWVNGTYGIAHAIVSSFEELGFLAAGTGADNSADQLVQNGIQTFSTLWASMQNLGMGNISLILANLFIGICVVATTFLTAVEIFMVRIEFWTVAMMSVILLPFAMSKYTTFLTESAVRSVFSLGIKVAVVCFLQAVAVPLLFSLTKDLKVSDVQNQFATLLQILLACLVLWMLVAKIPRLVQGLISGSPSLVSDDLFEHMPPNPGSLYGKAEVASEMQAESGKAASTSAPAQETHTALAASAPPSSSWLSRGLGIAGNMARLTIHEYNPFSQAAESSYNRHRAASQYLNRQK